MEWSTDCGGGSNALKASFMLSRHDGQWRLEMKIVVVTTAVLLFPEERTLGDTGAMSCVSTEGGLLRG